MRKIIATFFMLTMISLVYGYGPVFEPMTRSYITTFSAASGGGVSCSSITIINNATGLQNTGGTASLAFNTAAVPTNGNMLLVPISIGGSTAKTVADNHGNNFTEDVSLSDTHIGTNEASIWRLVIPAQYGSPYTITITPNASAAIDASVLEVGCQNGTPFDVQSSSLSAKNLTASTGNSATTSATSALKIMAMADSTGNPMNYTSPATSTSIYRETDGVNFEAGSGDYIAGNILNNIVTNSTYTNVDNNNYAVTVQAIYKF